MSKLKILLVEDTQSEIDVFQASMRRYLDEFGIEVEACIAKSIDEALTLLDNSYDGAIIDLKLDQEGDEGNKIIYEIHTNFRMPIIVFSGTPEHLSSERLYILDVHKKGTISYEDIVTKLNNVYKTGLTNIMGGRGVIEQTMDKIFWNNLHSKIPIWEEYAKSGKDTEKVLLRYTINHLLELLDHEENTYFPEEMYLSPPIVNHMQTGTILKEKANSTLHLVLSPACDLVLHAGNCKTDRILLCEIDNTNMSLVKQFKKELGIAEKKDNAENRLRGLTSNAFSMYYHYLPPVKFFDGGFINFRYVKSYKMKEISANFEPHNVQISAQFIKDIIARFSSYYARQGQPDFNREELYSQLKGL